MRRTTASRSSPPTGGDSASTADILPGASIPADLQRTVAREQREAWAYTVITHRNGTREPGLAVGGPVQTDAADYQLYYLFPLHQESQTLSLVERTMLFSGIALVLLLVVIAALVTRQVVRPVRLAAATAERLAAGRLRDRMVVRGEDDLASLASSFNRMAETVEQQISQLRELSRVQRRFVADVSHELRTPITTIRMAADVLHDARGDLPPELARSAELLQAQLDRFEALLADLLEISRHDAGAATLEAEPIDMRGVVAHVLDSAAPIAVRRGCTVDVDVPDRARHRRGRRAARAAHPAQPRVQRASSTAKAARCMCVCAAAPAGCRSQFATKAADCVPVRPRSSSAGSGGLTRLARARPVAPVSACPSRWRTRDFTAATCRHGASRAKAPSSGSPFPGRSVATSASLRWRSIRTTVARPATASRKVSSVAERHRTGARWKTWPAAFTLIALSTGCAGMPTGGSVHLGRALPAAGGLSDLDVRVLPPSWKAGLEPLAVVSGFLRATVNDDDDYAIARSYLTGPAASHWRPATGVTVYDEVALHVADDGPATSTHSTVRLQAPRIGHIDQRGEFVPQPGRLVAGFSVVRSNGSWRIDRAPDGVLLSSSDAQRSFHAADVYYLNKTDSTLVPDQILLQNSQRGVATALVSALLSGPSSWLAPAAHNGLPVHPALIGNVPVNASGVADVNLSSSVRQASAKELAAFSAQLVWTLRQIADVTAVRLLAEGAPLTVPGMPVRQPITSWQRYDPSAPPASHDVLYVSRGHLAATGGDITALNRSDPGHVASVARSRDGETLAVVQRLTTGMRLLVGRYGQQLKPRLSAATLTPPTFDAAGEVLTVANGPAGRASSL